MADQGEVTRKKYGLDLEGLPLENVDTVLVPRLLVEEMSQAIAAMQKLAAEGMVGVAAGLGLVSRRQRKKPLPPCGGCSIDVAVGLPHADDCTSDEAVHYRVTEIIKLEL